MCITLHTINSTRIHLKVLEQSEDPSPLTPTAPKIDEIEAQTVVNEPEIEMVEQPLTFAPEALAASDVGGIPIPVTAVRNDNIDT